MSFNDLLVDSCDILRRTVNTSGMSDTESWAFLSTAKCRLFKNAASLYDSERTQHATIIRTRFALKAIENIRIEDRISHEGRSYEVIEIIAPFRGQTKHHKVAVCQVITSAAENS